MVYAINESNTKQWATNEIPENKLYLINIIFPLKNISFNKHLFKDVRV